MSGRRNMLLNVEWTGWEHGPQDVSLSTVPGWLCMRGRRSGRCTISPTPISSGSHGFHPRNDSHAISRSSSNPPPNSAHSRTGTAIKWPRGTGHRSNGVANGVSRLCHQTMVLDKRGLRICQCCCPDCMRFAVCSRHWDVQSLSLVSRGLFLPPI